MGPKKKEREIDCVKIRSQEQTDHEIFLQAFEKPTQIYRYLRTRNMITPIFLYRNLSYMKDRIKRTNKSRSTFKVDSLLSKKMDEKKNGSANDKTLGEYMTLMFLGFFDKTLPDDEVEVETLVSKISHKKRKDSFKTLQERFGRSVVKINPDISNSNTKIPAVCVPTDNFKTPDESLHLSYKLQLNVKVLEKFKSDSEDPPESLPKRYKSQNIVYESELLVFDKQKRRLLSDGEYEISLQEKLQPTKNSPKKLPGWEMIPDTYIESLEKENSFEDYQQFPKLKFRLAWTKEKCDDLVDRPSALAFDKDESNKENAPDSKQNGAVDVTQSAEKTQIIYQFIYNNNSRQQMEPCENFCCIWCSLDCMVLYSLLKHLKLCHARFNFKYVPSNPAVRIDISINELYDGSPHDLIGSSSLAFSRAGPVRRTTVTRILVCRPRRVKPNLAEFLEIDENELNSQRPFITGHSRLYHHTMTCLPVHPKELDIESEDENDPVWLQQKTKMMIDEFTDVNEGEKEMMKLWNCHIMRHGYVGNTQIPLACEMFIELKGKELLQKNLYKNFTMHLCNLFDYGIISPEDYYKSIQKLQKLLSNDDDGRKVIIDAREEQVDYWDKIGSQKQIQLLEQQKKIQVNTKTAAPVAAVTSEKTVALTEKTIKRDLKSKLDDEKLHTAVVNLKNTKSGVTNTSNRKRDAAHSKEENVVIKRRRSTLRECTRPSRSNGTNGSRRTPKLQPNRRTT